MSLISDALQRVQQRRASRTQGDHVGPASILLTRASWLERIPSRWMMLMGVGGLGIAAVVATVFWSGLLPDQKGGGSPTVPQTSREGNVIRLVVPHPAAHEEKTDPIVSSQGEKPAGGSPDEIPLALQGQEPPLTVKAEPLPLTQLPPSVLPKKAAAAQKTKAGAPVLPDDTTPFTSTARQQKARDSKQGPALKATRQRAPSRKQERASSTAERPVERPGTALQYFQAGLQYQKEREFAKALEAYQRAVEINPSNAAAHNNLGVVYRDLGRLDDALDQYQKSLTLDPGFVEARNNLGVALYLRSKLPEALAAFKQALAIDPANITAYLNLGVVYKRLQRTEEALRAFRKVLLLKESHPEAHYNIALLLEEEGALTDAIAHFQKFLAFAADKYPARSDRVRKHLALLSTGPLN